MNQHVTRNHAGHGQALGPNDMWVEAQVCLRDPGTDHVVMPVHRGWTITLVPPGDR